MRGGTHHLFLLLPTTLALSPPLPLHWAMGLVEGINMKKKKKKKMKRMASVSFKII
jgi:hypothetical protein